KSSRMDDREKNGKGRMSKKSRRSRKLKKAQARLEERDRIENEVHNLLPDNRQVVRSEAKKLFEEDESDCITDRTPETPYNSDKELDEEALRQSHELDHNNLLAALNRVENNANVESNRETKGVQSDYEPIDNATLQTAILLIPYPPPPPANGPPLPQKFSLGAVYQPPHVMSAQSSDSKSSLSSKTGDGRSFTYTSSLGGSSVTTSASSSTTSLDSKTGSIVPPSQIGSVPSTSDISIVSATDISITLPSSVSNTSLQSETGSNVTGIWPADDRTDSSTEPSEKMLSVTGIPSPSVSSSSLLSTSSMATSPASPSLVSQTMSPLKEATMQESSDKDKPVPVLPSPSTTSTTTSAFPISQTGTPAKSAVNAKMPADGHTSSILSPIQPKVLSKLPPDVRMDIHPSSQTPVREKPQDFSHRSHSLPMDSSLYQPSGRYNSQGEFQPGDQTLEDIPDIPSEKSDQADPSPPMRTARESVSSTSLALTNTLPDRIYGEEDDEVGAKSDKQFVLRMTLKKNKKNEAGFEFEAKDPKEGRSKPRTPRKLKITTVFGGGERKYVPVMKKAADRPKKPTVSPLGPPPLPDDSRAHLTTVTDQSRSGRTTVTDRNTVTTDLLAAPSLPLSVTKKSDRVVPPSESSSNSDSTTPTLPTPISLLRTESSLLPSISSFSTPTTSPAARSPVEKEKKKKREGKEERVELSPVALSLVRPKKKKRSKKRKEE
ncbi:hypothetical protein PENTCL1PPCAC_10810, partial [Pristionchus entomophagus]